MGKILKTIDGTNLTVYDIYDLLEIIRIYAGEEIAEETKECFRKGCQLNYFGTDNLENPEREKIKNFLYDSISDFTAEMKKELNKLVKKLF